MSRKRFKLWYDKRVDLTRFLVRFILAGNNRGLPKTDLSKANRLSFRSDNEPVRVK